MVRSVLLTHGLNHKRADILIQNPACRAMIRSLVAGKACWEHILIKTAPHFGCVKLVLFSFRCHPHDQADALRWLQIADLFYIRGTGYDTELRQHTYSSLVDISDDPSCAELVLALQYEVLQNRLVYVGVCGAAQWAGESVLIPKGGMRQGL